MSDKYSSVEMQASYGIGIQMGQQLSANPFDGLDLNAVLEGIKDAFNKQTPQVSNADLNAAFTEIQQRMQAAKSKQFEGNIAEGKQFLAENAQKDGVTVTESGLQYQVLTEGSGARPTASSNVRTHYHGTLIDGTVFDSSYDRGQPAEFPVNGVIRGWTEALQMMAVGSKMALICTS